MNIEAQRYQPIVRIGNWFEDNCIREYKIQKFKNQRDRGELLVEKSRLLFDNFRKGIVLEAPTSHLQFGAIVQLEPSKLQIDGLNMLYTHPALSIIINEQVVRNSQNINEDCEVTVALWNRPCVRNSFRIVKGNGLHSPGEVLKYGEHFHLQCVEPSDDPILIYGAPKLINLTQTINTTFQTRKSGETNLSVGLIRTSKCGPGKEIPDFFANWFCIHLNRKMRFESEGETVPSNTPLVIVHAATNKNLAVENTIVNSLFGPELLVSLQSYQDVYKHETWKNHWMISNGHQTKAKV